MAGDAPDPWEKQPGESGRAFAAFQAYRDMPPFQRSIRRLASSMGVRYEPLGRWSRKFSWVSRAEAWDEEKDRVAREQALEEQRKFMTRLAAAGAMLQMKGLTRIRQFVDRVDANGNPVALRPGQQYIDEMSLADATRLVEAGSRMEGIGRSVRELDDEKQQPGVQVTMVNNPILNALTVNPKSAPEATEAMRKLARALGMDDVPVAQIETSDDGDSEAG